MEFIRCSIIQSDFNGKATPYIFINKKFIKSLHIQEEGKGKNLSFYVICTTIDGAHYELFGVGGTNYNDCMSEIEKIGNIL